MSFIFIPDYKQSCLTFRVDVILLDSKYSCLENPMDRGAWWAAVHGVTKSRTRLSDFTFTFHFHALEKEMATHSSVLAWRIPGTGEPGGLPSMGWHRVGHDWSDLAAAANKLSLCSRRTHCLYLPSLFTRQNPWKKSLEPKSSASLLRRCAETAETHGECIYLYPLPFKLDDSVELIILPS